MDKKWTEKEKWKRKLTKWIKNRQKQTKDGHWTKSGKKFKKTKCGQEID